MSTVIGHRDSLAAPVYVREDQEGKRDHQARCVCTHRSYHFDARENQLPFVRPRPSAWVCGDERARGISDPDPHSTPPARQKVGSAPLAWYSRIGIASFAMCCWPTLPGRPHSPDEGRAARDRGTASQGRELVPRRRWHRRGSTACLRSCEPTDADAALQGRDLGLEQRPDTRERPRRANSQPIPLVPPPTPAAAARASPRTGSAMAPPTAKTAAMKSTAEPRSAPPRPRGLGDRRVARAAAAGRRPLETR